MKNFKKEKIKRLGHSFLIRFLPFNNSTYSQNKFVSDIIENQHFIFSFSSFPFIVKLKLWIFFGHWIRMYAQKERHHNNKPVVWLLYSE